MTPAPFFLLRLDWQVLKPITRVPHFQGMLWSALLRHAYNPWLNHGESFHQTGLVLEPADFGVSAYQAGDRIALGLLVPVTEAKRLTQVLSCLDQATGLHGQFEPGRSIQLVDITCRVSGASWPSVHSRPLGLTELEPLLNHYRSQDELKLWFHAPLRLTKPPHCKNDGRYCGPGFFQQHPLAEVHLARALGLQAAVTLEREACLGVWLDSAYGGETQKTIGGFTGVLTMRRPPSETDLLTLLAASFYGIGKNRGFGLGVFRLERRDQLLGLVPLTKQHPLLGAMLDRDALRGILATMTDDLPGPDGITVADLNQKGHPALDELCADLQEGGYQPGGTKTWRVPNVYGGYRQIEIGNVLDRMLHMRAAQLLTPCIDPFLPNGCYAFRRGLGRTRALSDLRTTIKSGYRYGFKAEIQNALEHIDWQRLASLLSVLFPREPMLDLLACWFPTASNKRGLPAGNPLSPLLRNLYLEAFDTNIQRRGLKLFRHADELIVLSCDPISATTLQDWLTEALSPLKLTLNPSKNQIITPGQKFVFLGGYIINGEEVKPHKRRAALACP